MKIKRNSVISKIFRVPNKFGFSGFPEKITLSIDGYPGLEEGSDRPGMLEIESTDKFQIVEKISTTNILLSCPKISLHLV